MTMWREKLEADKTAEELRGRNLEASGILEKLRHRIVAFEVTKLRSDETIEEMRRKELKVDHTLKGLRRRNLEASMAVEKLKCRNLEASKTVEDLKRKILEADIDKKKSDQMMQEMRRKQSHANQTINELRLQYLEASKAAEKLSRQNSEANRTVEELTRQNLEAHRALEELKRQGYEILPQSCLKIDHANEENAVHTDNNDITEINDSDDETNSSKADYSVDLWANLVSSISNPTNKRGRTDCVEFSHVAPQNKKSNFGSEKLWKRWMFGSDMLKAFQEDSELCLHAVCALYRYQIHASKSGQSSNGGAFHHFNEMRGRALAEYLINRDPELKLRRSVSEVEKQCPYVLKDCQMLATSYYEKLFMIYCNGDDPFFTSK
ncbi:hypothetical protein ACJIZ3_004162 [Penstemon smallii]|uniref:Uncharacterized protein n=1 Tax=Penstemon smallii TaxID=265156 RepID=A0ABD3S1E1_9LAMI